MNRKVSLTIRTIVLVCGLALSGFMIWQLVSGTRMLDFDIETQGPLIVVVFGVLTLITLGSAISFFANHNFASTIFLSGILILMALILWIRHPDQEDIYRLYLIYGLIVCLLCPLVLDR